VDNVPFGVRWLDTALDIFAPKQPKRCRATALQKRQNRKRTPHAHPDNPPPAAPRARRHQPPRPARRRPAGPDGPHPPRPPPAPPLLWSPVAGGAARLAARVPLEGGPRLVVPLPLPRDLYESDFSAPNSRQEFDDLLGRAEQVFELPLVAGNTADSVRSD